MIRLDCKRYINSIGLTGKFMFEYWFYGSLLTIGIILTSKVVEKLDAKGDDITNFELVTFFSCITIIIILFITLGALWKYAISTIF